VTHNSIGARGQTKMIILKTMNQKGKQHGG